MGNTASTKEPYTYQKYQQKAVEQSLQEDQHKVMEERWDPEAGKATPATPASISPWRTTSCVFSGRTVLPASWIASA